MKSEKPNPWPVSTLGDVLTVSHGFAFKSESFVGWREGLPVLLKPGDFSVEGGLAFRPAKSQGYAGETQQDYTLRAGDLLVVMTCMTPDGELLGAPGIVPEDGRTYLHNQRLGRVTCGRQLDTGFAYWLLLSRRVRDQVVSTASGTTVLHTSPKRIENVTVQLPPLHEQRRIAWVLGTLDALSQGEARLAANSHELVRTIFVEKFVSDATSVWKSSSLSDIARFVNGRNFTKAATGAGRPVVRIKEIRGGISASTVWNEVDAKEDHVVYPDDLLFAWSGTLCVERWPGPEGLVNQHIFKVIPNAQWPMWFVEGWVRQHLERFKHVAAAKATTMGHIQRGDLDKAEVRLPPANLLAEFEPAMQALCDRAAVATQRARTSAALRDALLPKLISGEIRVPDTKDVREAIEAASAALPAVEESTTPTEGEAAA